MFDLTPTPDSAPAWPRASFDRVQQAVQQLGLRYYSQGPSQLFAACPVHEEKTPSLHITWRSGQRGGYTLLHCFACHARAEDLVEPLGLTMGDLFDEPLPERDQAIRRVGKSPQQRLAGRRRGRLGRLPALIAKAAPADGAAEPEHQWVEIERYPYVDADGHLVQEVVREECTAEGEGHKSFRQVFVGKDGRQVKTKPGGFQPVLYRAPQVREAVAAGQTVWLVEGEKDVHAAERHGLTATTNAQGGKSFPDALVEELRGATVHVVLDRDDVGWARGVDLHAKLTAAGAAVRLKLPATEQVKSDFSDHLDGGYAVEDLVDVHVYEVATWQALTAVKDKFQGIRQAAAEAEAHLALAREGAGEEAMAHRRHARRWVMETEVRHEALRDLADRVQGSGLRVGTEWAGDAMQHAEQLLRDGTDVARQCHEAVGVAVPPSLRLEPAVAETPADADDAAAGVDGRPPEASQRAPSAGSFAAVEGKSAAAPIFRILNGQVVQWEPNRRRRDHEFDEDDGAFKVVISLAVQVIQREYLEVEEPHELETAPLLGRASLDGQAELNPRAPRQLIAVVVTYPDPVTGEAMHLRVGAEQWKDHSWLDSLPGPVDYDHKRAGMDTVQRAVLAVSDQVEDRVLYRSTGWRTDGDVHKFVHAGGVITVDGTRPAAVAFTGPLVRYNLPDPTRDPARLRAAFIDHSACMLDRLPARVGAPLLGQVFRSVLGHNPWVVALIGPPGSYKTSVAAKAMHHLGELWELQKPSSSMSGNGDTLNALRFKLHAAKDVLYWMDDFAPTKSWLDAQRNLEETARLIHNQEERSRSARDGLSISEGTGPRASGLATSEVMPRPGSGAERLLVVPLARDEVDTGQLFPLDGPESRHGRALLMASFIQWLAADLPGRRQTYLARAEDYAAALTRDGETVRQAAAITQTFIGWEAVTDFLTATGAISSEERQRLLDRVHIALQDASRAAVDPDLPTRTGARVRELLAYALRSGLVHVADVRTGDCPPWPLASRLGWRRTATEVDGQGQPVRSRVDRQGQQLGFVLHDPSPKDRGRVLMLESTALEAVLKLASGTQAEQFQIDRGTACRALHDEGVLIADDCEHRTRFTVKCAIHCEERSGRMVTLWLDRVLGDDPDRPDPPLPEGTPPPRGPDVGQEHLDPWFDPNPHQVDASQQADVAFPEPTPAAAVLPHDDNPPQMPEEDLTEMSEDEFNPRPHTDRNGVVGWTEPTSEVAPCVVCSIRCGVVIAGERVHLLCWERSTAAERSSGRHDSADPPVKGAPSSAPGDEAAPMQTSDSVPVHTGDAGQATTGPAAAPAHRAASRTAQPTVGFRAAAAVVDVDGIWCSNGDRLDPPRDVRHAGDLVQLSQQLRLGTQVTKYLTAEGQVWVGERLLRAMGVDIDAIIKVEPTKRDDAARTATRNQPVVTEALAGGFQIGGRDGDSLGRWSRVYRGRDKSVRVVLMPALNWDGVEVPLLHGNPDHATLARRIGLLTTELGHPYQLSGATTGLDLMVALRWRDHDRLFEPRTPIEPAALNVELDISWCRPPIVEEQSQRYVHAYDRSGSYLAGVSGLELGVGDPVHHPDGCAFQPKLPGYWLMQIPDAGDWRMPHPLDPRGTLAGRTRWVTTPSLQFAVEQGYDPTVLEAYTWPEHARILDPWYERIRDARTHLDRDDTDAQAARSQLKAIYAPTIGILGSKVYMEGRRGYAPDRRHHIVAKARTNILRRIVQIGRDSDRWPVAVIADTVVYTSDEQDPVKAWPGAPAQLGRALGQYKPEGSGLLEEHLPFLTGGTYAGKQALVDDVAGSE